MSLAGWLVAAAVLQCGIAMLNLFLVPLLKFQPELVRAPLLLREIFHVHAWFISLTLSIFATLTFRFAREIAFGSNELGRWLAAAIGIFWGVRTVLQVAYYSSSHWRGRLDRTLVHVALLLLYGGFAAVYLWAAFGG